MEGLEKLDEDRLELLKKELGMTPEGVKQDVDAIISWVNKQPHLPDLKGNGSCGTWRHCPKKINFTENIEHFEISGIFVEFKCKF